MANTTILAALCAASLFLSDRASGQIRHRYSFEGSGTVALDSVGSADGTLMDGAILNGAGEVALDGASAYVNLPLGLIAGLEAATFEAWYEWGAPTIAPWTRIMDIGSNSAGPGAQGTGETYLVLTPMAGSGISEHAGVVKTAQSGSSIKVYSGLMPVAGQRTHLAWTFDSAADSMSLYVDGVLTGTQAVTENLADIVEENNWLGRSQFVNDSYFNGTISEFRIYGGALGAAEVSASFAAGPDASLGTGLGTAFCSNAANNSTGVPGQLAAVGQASAAAGNLTLLASSLPHDQFGVYVVSRIQGFVPGPGSNGNICLAGSIGILSRPGQIMHSGPGGTFELAIDLTMIPQGGGFVPVVAGDTWNFQAWYRDRVGQGSNFTNGVEIAFL